MYVSDTYTHLHSRTRHSDKHASINRLVALTVIHTYSYTPHPHAPTHAEIKRCTPPHTHTHTRSLTHSLTHSLTPHSHPLTHVHSHSRTLAPTHTHTHTHTHTLTHRRVGRSRRKVLSAFRKRIDAQAAQGEWEWGECV